MHLTHMAFKSTIIIYKYDMICTYQLDGDDAYCFGKDKQYALFQSPFQAAHWSQAEVLFVDIDYTDATTFLFTQHCVLEESDHKIHGLWQRSAE